MIFAKLVQGERNGKKKLVFLLPFPNRRLTSANPSISIPQKFAFFPITQSHAV